MGSEMCIRDRTTYLSKLGIITRRFFPSRREMESLYNLPENSLRVYLYYIVRARDLSIRQSKRLAPIVFGDKSHLEFVSRKNMLVEWLEHGDQ